MRLCALAFGAVRVVNQCWHFLVMILLTYNEKLEQEVGSSHAQFMLKNDAGKL